MSSPVDSLRDNVWTAAAATIGFVITIFSATRPPGPLSASELAFIASSFVVILAVFVSDHLIKEQRKKISIEVDNAKNINWMAKRLNLSERINKLENKMERQEKCVNDRDK